MKDRNIKNKVKNGKAKKLDFKNLSKREFVLTLITIILFIIVLVLCYLLFYKYV